ncbi:hypothetical protein BJ742DRAFT_253426 [Cladochytrium replicatum]|nr:hypothetical protein BJ742DRAFT_253426 [Cladochytrium replicatum]
MVVNIACLAWGSFPEKAFIVPVQDPATTYIATLKEAVHTNLRLDVSILPHDLLLFVVDESVSVDDKRLLEVYLNVKSQPGKLRFNANMADGEGQAAEATVCSLFRTRRIQNPLSPISRYFSSERASFVDDDLKIQLLVYVPGTISVLSRSLSPPEVPWQRMNQLESVTQDFLAQITPTTSDTKSSITRQFTFQSAHPNPFQFPQPSFVDASEPFPSLIHTCRWSGLGHCHAVFSDPTQLRDHIVKDHIGKKSEGNVCLTCSWEGCGIQFKKRDHIVSHIKRHVESWPFSCMTCRRSYKHAQDLRKHERTHRKADDQVISAAGGAFKNTHSEKRPQRCTPGPQCLNVT